MSGLPSVKSCSPLGDRLLCLLKSGETVHNPLKLLCRDSRTVRTVHRDVLQSSSAYFRLILNGDNRPNSEILIEVPVNSHILDLLIEFVYTTRAVSFDVRDLVGLFAAADLFQLDELATQLKDFFHGHLIECLQNELFLADQSYEDVSRFMAIFPICLSEQDQIEFIQCISRWAARHTVESSRTAELIARVIAVPPIRVSDQLALGDPQAHMVPMLVTPIKVLKVVDLTLVRHDCPDAIVENFYYGREACATGNSLLVINYKKNTSSIEKCITVFDWTTGEQRRCLDQPIEGELWYGKLSVQGGRVYTFAKTEVYLVKEDHLSLLCRVRSTIFSLAVISHDADGGLTFCYRSRENQLFVVQCNRNGNVISEKCIISGIAELIGVHEDRVFAYTEKDELMVIQRNLPFWKYSFEKPLQCGISCGYTIYLKVNERLNVVNTVTRLIKTIPIPRGKLKIQQIMNEER